MTETMTMKRKQNSSTTNGQKWLRISKVSLTKFMF